MPNQNSINAPTIFAVDKGGLGAGTHTTNRLLVGDGTNAVTNIATGTVGQYLQSNGAGVDPSFVTFSPIAGSFNVNDLLFVSDTKASATAGGSFTAGAWRTRDLNTVQVNNISGASLATNQITLPTGTYFIIARCPAACGISVDTIRNHKAKLYNVTDTADVLIGTSEYQRNVSLAASVITYSEIRGNFTIASSKTFELQHQCTTTQNTSGFGWAAGFGINQIFSFAWIFKVA